MIESLGKKMGLFETLLLKTESQNECITGKNHEQANWAQFEVLMIEKESTIKAVDELDSGFEQVFERVKPELDRNKDEYREEIKTLQENISALTDLGVKIAAREERNRQEVDRIMTAAKAGIGKARKNMKATSGYITSMYGAGNMPDATKIDSKKQEIKNKIKKKTRKIKKGVNFLQ